MSWAGEEPSPGACTNDDICDAVDFGMLTGGAVLGNAGRGLYDNTCATNTTDPQPGEFGSFYNDAGVWFSFRTGDNPTPLIFIGARNDPEGTGDEIHLEIAVYRSFGGDCDDFLRFEGGITASDLSGGFFFLNCPRANSTYFILVDGNASTGSDMRQGVFGIEVREIEVTEAPDSPCRAEELGLIPDGGSAATDGVRSNACATSFSDPRPSAFDTQVTVWFTFQAPASGHVRIDGFSSGTVRPLGVQLALFLPDNRRCTGTFQEIASGYSGTSSDESLEITCLYPGETYYIMVDGYGDGGRGMFSIQVTDLGDITPVTRLDTVLCFGDSLQVGNSVYTATGNYADTLQVEAGCDSIVLTNLTVLDPLELRIDQTEPAIWQKAPGTATARAAGGAGGYAYEWCDGITGETNDQLVADTECQVQVTDERGCHNDTSFTVAFTTRISITYDTAGTRCAGDSSGYFSFAAGEGLPPYSFQWRSLTGTREEEGQLAADGQPILYELLPAGDYELTVSDAYSDTTVVLTIAEPPPLAVALVQQQDASCFGVCDGVIEVAAVGGTGALRYRWNNGMQEPGIDQLCAGVYALTVADQNDCWVEASYAVGEPPEFVALTQAYQEVSCYGGADGVAVVRTNGKSVSFAWDNGRDSAVVRGLQAGTYTVTATNGDGCQDIATVRITEPSAPLTVRVEEQQPVRCFGASDGILQAVAGGPFETLSFEWTGGHHTGRIEGVSAGAYVVVLTNERGCTAEAAYTLTQPEAIRTVVTPRDITCLDPDNGGGLRLDSVGGGQPGYEYSLDGVFFQSASIFNGLLAGEYEVIVRDRSGCEASFPAKVQGPPELHVDLGDDRTLVLGDTIRLAALANSSNLIYHWEATDLSPASNQSTIEVGPIHSTALRVTVVDTVNSCTATDQVFLTVRKDRRIYIPNAFSPNGDGVNDHFMIYGGRGVQAVRSFRIFSRSGALVHEAYNLMPGDEAYAWDGAFRGQALSSGVFVYAAEIEFLDGVVEVFKGDLVLVR
jgi:gliding motility-associated-like protein